MKGWRLSRLFGGIYIFYLMRISFYMFNYVLNDEKFIVSLNNNNEMKIRSCESKENRFEGIIILEEK